jgi:hypothetical protein
MLKTLRRQDMQYLARFLVGIIIDSNGEEMVSVSLAISKISFSYSKSEAKTAVLSGNQVFIKCASIVD